MYNYNFLRGKIVEKCRTQAKYAELLDISIQELTKKLSNRASFTQSQILLSIQLLELNDEELKKCFFLKQNG